MELILMCVFTIVSMCIGLYIGKVWGEDIGFGYGYQAGTEDSIEDTDKIDNFPRTLDGKFFSTDAALRNISKSKDGDK